MASPSKSPLPSTATICVSCAPADPSAIVLLNSRPSVITRTQAPLLAPGRHTICLVYLSPGCIPTRSAHARAGHWLMFTACPHPPHFYRSPDSLMYEISLWRAPIPTVGSRSSSLISHKGITKVDPFFVLVSFPFLPTSNPDYLPLLLLSPNPVTARSIGSNTAVVEFPLEPLEPSHRRLLQNFHWRQSDIPTSAHPSKIAVEYGSCSFSTGSTWTFPPTPMASMWQLKNFHWHHPDTLQAPTCNPSPFR
ncbi:hypothetical protein IV203_026981 [Nitzschia inconspicua]|uniref:Uncharacterized protein n=1 Tax=Nitzschia inconspicua TaxID=303405 RepID=A0A9K3LJN4_9STRA|nr:hypothetical protein IV203_026981 [Nitzschia inconspicua]